MTRRPGVQPSPAWAFPIPDVATFENGLTLWAYHLPGQFILSCNLVLELPLNAEPPGREGVATLTVRALDEGTGAHPGPRLSAALEDVGGQFAGMVGLSTTQCFLDLPSDSLDAGLALLAEMVTTPAFAEADVVRIKANRLAEIDQQESRGSFVASQALRHYLVADGLRAGRTIGGEARQVAALQPDDLAGFHAASYGPDQAILIVAGDLTGIDAVGAARHAFASWNPPVHHRLPEPVRPGTAGRHLIHRQAAVQADIRFGWYGIDQCDPRWPGLQVALAIMGGLFGSRLNTTLREERGYTYGVSMSARPFRTGGIIDFAASTRTATATDLIAEALDILHAQTPFTEQEVRDAVGYLTMSAPLGFGTAEAVAAQAANLAAARLDLDHVSVALADLARVTPTSAMDAYRSLIDPGEATIVVVADAGDLGDLGFG